MYRAMDMRFWLEQAEAAARGQEAEATGALGVSCTDAIYFFLSTIPAPKGSQMSQLNPF